MRLLAAALALLGLAACAEPARVSQMTTSAVDVEKVAASPGIQGSVQLGSVTGGETTNPLWTSEVGTAEFRQALDQSLKINGLLASDPAAADYLLTAKLVEVDQPLVGFDMSVRSTVDYTVYDARSEAVFFQKTVRAAYTASFSSSYIAVKRLQLANEGSIRDNIGQFLRAFIAHWAEQAPARPLDEGVSVSLLDE